jgi:hypothetical protein
MVNTTTIVDPFSKAPLRNSYDRWNLDVQALKLDVQAQKCAAVVGLRALEQLRVEEVQ